MYVFPQNMNAFSLFTYSCHVTPAGPSQEEGPKPERNTWTCVRHEVSSLHSSWKDISVLARFSPPASQRAPRGLPEGLPAPVQVTPTAPCHPREPNHTPFTGYLCAFAESCSNPGTYFHPSLAFDKVSEKLKSNAAAFALLRT